ncbi:ketoacyl-ACP synthase III [Thermodesulfovibrionales bacterium]|nr:ketoacyl-ACP synthase III [Thermodesulfovibrionales bacterium]
MLKAKIIATGSYLPEKRLTNFDLEKMIDTSDDWITERTGIKERRIAEDGQSTSDLAYEASKNALRQAGLEADDLDLIIVATVTGDMIFPATACLLQNLLSAKKAAAFDINAVCSGFVYGLSVANSFIRAGTYKRILLVGAEIYSRIIDWEDRTTCILFGDGAGAVILEATDGDSGIISTRLCSDGSLWEILTLPGGGSKYPPSEETIRKRLHFLKMNGKEIFKAAVKALQTLVDDTLKENNLKPSQLSVLILHQANLRIIQAAAARLGLPMDKVVVNIDKYGNTSAASVPIALDEVVRAGKVKEGDYILLEAFGGGLTWASALIKW